MPEGSGSNVYQPKGAVALAAQMGLYTGGVGFFISAIQNALTSHNRGAMGVFTRTGGTIGFFALMGATFAFAEACTANFRSRDDSLNAAAGGCAAGLVAGAKMRSVPYGLASCAVLGGLMGTFDATGSTLAGRWRAQGLQSVDERKKHFFKQNPPQPIQAENM